MILDVMRRMKEAVGGEYGSVWADLRPFLRWRPICGEIIFLWICMMTRMRWRISSVTAAVWRRGWRSIMWKRGMDVIAVVDPLISQISEDHFGQFMHEPFSGLFAHIRELGAFSSFFVCGDATRNIEAMCRTAPDSISIDENVDLLEAKKITDRYNITVGGNIPLTTIMLHGTQQDNMKFVLDLSG